MGDEMKSTALMDVGAGGELRVSSEVATTLQEVQGAMFLAKQFPRDLKVVYGELMIACKRPAMAEIAEYSYPRGNKQIHGPSVNLARVAAQCLGNVRWGLDILRNDDATVSIRGWAWDIQKNTRVSADDTFKKVIFRKGKGNVTPDERDLRELINRRGAILIRNCLLQIIPRDLVDDAVTQCRKTLAEGITDPRSAAKQLIQEFDEYGVTVEMLNEYLGHDKWGKDDLVTLMAVLNGLRDGQTRRDDVFTGTPQQSNPTGSVDLKMQAGDEANHQPIGGTLAEHEAEKVDAETGEISTNVATQAEADIKKMQSDIDARDDEERPRADVIRCVLLLEEDRHLTGAALKASRNQYLDGVLDLNKAAIADLSAYETALSAGGEWD